MNPNAKSVQPTTIFQHMAAQKEQRNGKMTQHNSDGFGLKSENDLASKFNIKRRIIGTVSVLFSALLYRGIYNMAPKYLETFSSFGKPLPAITKYFSDYHELFLWLAISSLLLMSFWVVGIFSKCFALKILTAIKYNLYFSILFFVLYMISLYLPIIQMGSQ